MTKLVIMVGLPASGKTTRAMEIVKNGNTVRVNRDLLRTMLHFDKWTGRNESLTVDAEVAIVKAMLTHGTSVVVDDVNLNPKNIEKWKAVAKETNSGIQYERIDTPWNECIQRDNFREKKVGPNVIIQMAMQYGLYPKPKKGFVICDLDGTLADITHRLHFIKEEKRDWDGFFSTITDDIPRTNIYEQVQQVQKQGYDLILVSARPERYRSVTELWLRKMFKDLYYIVLIMRPNGDRREDSIVKQELYDKYFKDKYPIYAIFDDRRRVIDMWKSNDLNVINVGGENNDF